MSIGENYDAETLRNRGGMGGVGVSRRILITKAALLENPNADWNGFVDLLTGTDWEELTPSQRPAALAFRYESEVQNGGNLQYLINNGASRGDETVHALKQIGAASQAGVLEEALRRWRAAARLSPADNLEYQAIAGEAEFDALDRDFHACQITLIDLLRHHFAEHKEHFVMYE